MSVNIYANAFLEDKVCRKGGGCLWFFQIEMSQIFLCRLQRDLLPSNFFDLHEKMLVQKLDRLTDKISDMKENCWAKC